MLKNRFETTILAKKNSLSYWDFADVFSFLRMFSVFIFKQGHAQTVFF